MHAPRIKPRMPPRIKPRMPPQIKPHTRSLPLPRTPPWSLCGRYASYWNAFLLRILFVKSLFSFGRDVKMRKHFPIVFSMARSSSVFVPGVYSSYPSINSRTLCFVLPVKMDSTSLISSFSRSCSSATSSAREQFWSTFLNGIKKTKSKGNSERKFYRFYNLLRYRSM